MVKDAVPLGECGRALVVKLRHHGDVLLAAPVLSVLKAHAPAIEVDALVYDDTAPMLAGHPALAQLHVIGRRWRSLGVLDRLRHENALFRELRGRRYDLVLHLSERMRKDLTRMLIAVTEGNESDVVKRAESMGSPNIKYDRKGLQREVGELLSLAQDARIHKVQLGRLVMGIARPHILPITAKITERANVLLRNVRTRFARKSGGANAPGA